MKNVALVKSDLSILTWENMGCPFSNDAAVRDSVENLHLIKNASLLTLFSLSTLIVQVMCAKCEVKA